MTKVDIKKKQPDWTAAFLSVLQKSGTVRSACEMAGIARNTVYKRREIDPEFDAAWKEAKEDFADSLEERALSRAMSKDDPSDTMVIFMLKAARPEKYRERYDLSGEFKHVDRKEIDIQIRGVLASFGTNEPGSGVVEAGSGGSGAAGQRRALDAGEAPRTP